MIPTADFLEQWYEPQEVGELLQLKSVLSRMPEHEQGLRGRAALRAMWPDEVQYIEKTHFIKTKGDDGIVVKQLRLNYAQQRFHKDVIVKCRKEKRPIRGIILKARQLGFSTYIQSWQFEQVDRLGLNALTLSYDEPSTNELFGKSKHVHRKLWFPQKLFRDSSEAIELENGGAVHARTSGNLSAGRGDTYQVMHCSEVPMWAAAGETLTSAKQAISFSPATAVFIESTAKGAVGEFYDAWNTAEKGRGSYVPFFAPWFWDPTYSLDFGSTDERNHFGKSLDLSERRLVERHKLTLEQVKWRRFKIVDDLEGSEAKFRQEFPSTPKEAFLTTGSPVFKADMVSTLEDNSTRPLWQGDIALEFAGYE
jgi:hypothetical protein